MTCCTVAKEVIAIKNLKKVSEACGNLIVTVEDRIAIITMHRPKALNALNNQTLEELDRVIGALEQCDDIWGCILTGSGKAFAAGADIEQMMPYGGEEGRQYADFAQRVFNRLEQLQKPVLAAVNGYALGGGCELALSCDFCYASEKARFGQPEVNLGVIPCFGGTQRLSRAVGVRRAKELIYTGRHITAEEALEYGLVNEVTAAEELLPKCMETMRLITSKAPIAVRYAKRAIQCGADMDLSNGLVLEKDLAAFTFATEDKMIGMSAFLNKQIPTFKNK